MHKKSNQQGFTLIELLLVVVIIGILLAVIVPRAWRANVDAKYGLVRQNATELASFTSQWVEQMMEAQDLESTSKQIAYYNSLTRGYYSPQGNDSLSPGSPNGQWIGRDSGLCSWNDRPDNYGGKRANVGVSGRLIGGVETPPESSVEELIPPEKVLRNPFSGANIFMDFPEGTVIPGAIAAGRDADEGYGYFAFVFQGTDSQPGSEGYNNSASPGHFHAGMALDLAGLRNGVFMARVVRF